MRTGGIGGSIFLVAVGAILYWGVSVEGEGFNLNTIGLILMVVGGIGLVLSLLFWSSFSPYGRRDREVVRERDVVYDDRRVRP